MKKGLLCFYIAFTVSISSSAEWYRINGKYSSIEYTQGYKSTADSLLKIAELSIPRLAKMVKLPLAEVEKAPARIILTDAMDISNGYSLENTVVIYTISSMYLPMWTGNIHWYQQVLTHELAHYITFKKLRRNGNKFFGEVSNIDVPRWFYEGVAQYFSETWNTFRGDISLKNALLTGRLTIRSMYNLSDGRLLYASGHAFTRYLVTEYGDSSLIKLMDYKKKDWFYNFEEAFREIYGKSVEEIFPDFYRNLVIYYGDRLADYPIFEAGEILPDFGERVYQLIPLSTKDSTYLVSQQLSPNQQYLTAMIIEYKNKKKYIRKYISNHYNTDLIISPDKNLIAYGRYNMGTKNDQNSLNYRWFIYNRSNGETKEIAAGLKVKYGVFLNFNRLILINVADTITEFISFDINSEEITPFFRTKMQVGIPERSNDGGLIFSAQTASGQRDIFHLNNNKLQRLTRDSLDNRRPIQVNDTHIIFNRLLDNKPTLALYDLKGSTLQTLVNAQDDYWLHNYNREDREIVLASFDPLKKIRYTVIPLDTLLTMTISPQHTYPDNRYSHWTKKEPEAASVLSLPDTTMKSPTSEAVNLPQFSLINIMNAALPLYTKSDGWGIGAMTTWVEPLQRQLLSGMVAFFGTGLENSFIMLNSITRAYNSYFSLNYYHGPVIFPYYEHGEFVAKQDIGGFSWAKPINIWGSRRLSFSPTASYTYRNIKTKKDYTDIPSQFSYHGASAGIDLDYNLPTAFYPALAKRRFNLSMIYFNSFESKYKFSISEINMTIASDILSERLGIMATGSYLYQNGAFPLEYGVGIDSYYELDMPRDFTYTRTVRGVNRNIYGNKLLWTSGEVIYYLTQKSPMMLLFLPINNLTINGFYDYAKIENGNGEEVYSYGAQLSFGDGPLRLGAGYVESFYNGAKDDIQYYWRISLLIPKHIVF